MRKFLESAVAWPGFGKRWGKGRSRMTCSSRRCWRRAGASGSTSITLSQRSSGASGYPSGSTSCPGTCGNTTPVTGTMADSHVQTWNAVDSPLLTTLAAAQDGLALDTLLTLAGIEPGMATRHAMTPRSPRHRMESLSCDHHAGPAAVARIPLLPRQPARFLHGAVVPVPCLAAVDYSSRTWPRRPARPTIGFPTSRWLAGAAGDESEGASGDRPEPAGPYGPLWPARPGGTPRGRRSRGRPSSILCGWSGADHQGEQTRARFENTWYTVHERVGDTSGYLSDVDRAWRLAEEAYRRSTIFHRHRPSVPLCPDRHLSVQFGREYSSRAAGRARRKRHMAWSSRVGLRPTDPRTRTAYQGAGRAGPPPGTDRAGPGPPRGAGGGAGHRGRGVPVRRRWPRWPPT